MSQRIIFNDASLPFPSNMDPRKHLKVFFTILKKTSDAQVSLSRVTEASGRWSDLVYSEHFSFGEWLNNGLDHDERRRIKSVMTKVVCPVTPEAERIVRDSIFVLKEDDAINVEALGFASTLGATSLSFPSHLRWREQIIKIQEMKEDGDEVSIELHAIKNVSDVCQIEMVLNEIRDLRIANTRFFNELEMCGNCEFPNLLFNKEALKILKKSWEVSQYQAQIISAFEKLNSGIVGARSLSDLSDNTGLDISGESRETMRNTKCARKRRFSHPSLDTALFVVHVKNFSDSKRMHILPDYTEEKICIGYFGDHLPTISKTT